MTLRLLFPLLLSLLSCASRYAPDLAVAQSCNAARGWVLTVALSPAAAGCNLSLSGFSRNASACSILQYCAAVGDAVDAA
ncbi:hypothetical protein [Massilia sp. HP4]|uniref:hypothetical protein n=1 Tax=Massilia sp. HP4 TaxID=2562316 RepID=UPI0010BF73BD|nr:hypothetical protein [Massilia sp. HP4]